MPFEDEKQTYIKRYNNLRQEGLQWYPAWKDLSTYINPTRGSFDAEPRSGKMIDHQTLLDSKATKASKILSSGMTSGMTSPSRPWFKLSLSDKDLAEYKNVRIWLDIVGQNMLDICNNSNIYGIFQSMYEEIGIFGTACSVVLEDINTIVRGRNFTVGEYFIATDETGRVNTMGREFNMTVEQVYTRFGKENVSQTVRTAYANNQLNNWCKLKHLIEPNDERIEGKEGNKNMPFRSVYWEDSDGSPQFLRISGFDEFPVLAPRWDLVTTDMAYGYGPGWFALGDVKQLQKTILDKLLAQEKLHNPPMQTDSSVDGGTNFLPGGITKVSSNVPNAGVRPAYQINPNLESFIESINTLHQNIDADFFVNLFLMLVNIDKTNMTATEVAERQQEKIMMMGPVLERLQNEMLNPFLERLFGIMARNNMIPPMPKEMSGQVIKIEYISVLAQAQKAIGVTSIDRVVERVGMMAQMNPQVLDVVDFDEMAREIAKMEGIPAKLMLEQKIVAQIREQRQQAQQMQQSAEMANSAADTAKKMSETDMDTNNALTSIMSGVQGQ